MQQRILVTTSAAHRSSEVLGKLGAEIFLLPDYFFNDKCIEALVASASQILPTIVIIDLCDIAALGPAFTPGSIAAGKRLADMGVTVFILTRSIGIGWSAAGERLWKYLPMNTEEGDPDYVIVDCEAVPHRGWETILAVADQFGPRSAL